MLANTASILKWVFTYFEIDVQCNLHCHIKYFLFWYLLLLYSVIIVTVFLLMNFFFLPTKIWCIFLDRQHLVYNCCILKEQTHKKLHQAPFLFLKHLNLFTRNVLLLIIFFLYINTTVCTITRNILVPKSIF